ncbi:NAD-dependent protein deacetylase [Diplonema papillatum]|nr:NAD-dependent protein deacetylase [Diplonema papillatum]
MHPVVSVKSTIQLAADLLRVKECVSKGNVFFLTGAGCSTDSGIPDYRGPNGSYTRGYKPLLHEQFMREEYHRKRYWVRSMLSWPSFSSKEPNPCHDAIERLQRAGKISSLVTQNVDCLHRHPETVHLHGRLDEVICVECQHVTHRNEWQVELENYNPLVAALVDRRMALNRSDGDSEVGDEHVDAFIVPPCSKCTGLKTKPHVVLFGSVVPSPVVESVMQQVAAADAAVFVGTSLMVFSSFRFARAASQLEKPIHIINMGPTRADSMAVTKVEEPVADTLAFLADGL